MVCHARTICDSVATMKQVCTRFLATGQMESDVECVGCDELLLVCWEEEVEEGRHNSLAKLSKGRLLAILELRYSNYELGDL